MKIACLQPPGRASAGVALVVVLSILVLLTVLVVAFFAAVQTDTQSSTANRHLASVQRLSELPLEIIKVQIRSATTIGQTGTLPASTNTWVSQPGLLRAFNHQGNLVQALKLYSSGVMETNSVDFIGTEIPSGWANEPNRWVDLNEPFQRVSSPENIYPIVNPAATNWAEGLSFEAGAGGQPDATMPVEWLYVLQDGDIAPQSDITAANPPVGRIAFWTDDESCKININTAGERTMWDRPRVWAWTAANNVYAKNQPSTGEYNAYPGHPATVSLSAALGNHPAFEDMPSSELVETMLSLTPRYAWGGSENRAKSIWDTRISLDRTKPGSVTKNDRLFASVGEYLFDPGRNIPIEGLKDALRDSDFLITESSRAPELNVFGLPRIGIWPISTDPAKRTIYDNLIARSLTIGQDPGKAYYFQRATPLSDSEATAIPRNWALMEYLDSLTQRPVNGFGGSFNTKWGSDEQRQILTQIFDYIRGGVNLTDTSRDEADYGKQFTPANQPGYGMVLPTVIPAWDTRGFGRAPIMTHAALVFYAYEYDGTGKEGDPVLVLPPDTTQIHALLWFNFFTPSQGLAPYGFPARVTVDFDSGFAINGQPLEFRGNASDRFVLPTLSPAWGGHEGMSAQGLSSRGISGFRGGNSLANIGYELHTETPNLHTAAAPSPPESAYEGSVQVTGPSFDFTGATIEVEFFMRTEGGEIKIQSYEIEFPDSTTPWPVPLSWGESAFTNPPPHRRKLFENRDPGSGTGKTVLGRGGSPAQQVDVIRTMEIKDGDARMLGGLSPVPASYFAPGEGYFGSGRMSGSLLYSKKVVVPEAEFGKHVDATFKDITSFVSELAVLPEKFDSVPLTSLRGAGWAGDFDNGYLREPDGAYINKPDEGHIFPEPSGNQIPYSNNTPPITIGTEEQSTWDPRIDGFFSPTRQIPSPVMFGSLPAAAKRGRPWETLLFSPNSQAAMVPDGDGTIGHPGAEAPKDHLLLDLFWMPVVEPYAISEPFSTAGKINLNQRLIPFTHINRETALHGLLKNLELMAVPHAEPHSQRYRSGGAAADALRAVNVPATVAEISKVLDPDGNKGRGVFRSASEICDIFLIPEDASGNSIQAYWQARQLTGDNSREMPYNYLYPLLTTKSNTYQVHYRVQSLTPLRQKADYDPANDFAVNGEQRGSYVIERFLNADDERFSASSPAVNTDETPLNEFYQFRILRHKRFAPGS